MQSIKIIIALTLFVSMLFNKEIKIKNSIVGFDPMDVIKSLKTCVKLAGPLIKNVKAAVIKMNDNNELEAKSAIKQFAIEYQKFQTGCLDKLMNKQK